MMRFQRRHRTSFTKDQLNTLHEAFNKSHYPEARERNELASMTNLEPARIQVWFQNQRAKDKKCKSVPAFSLSSISSFNNQSTSSSPMQEVHHNHRQLSRKAAHYSRQHTPPLNLKDNHQDCRNEPEVRDHKYVYVFSSAIANEAAEAVREGNHRTILHYYDNKYSNHNLNTDYLY